MRLLVRVLQGLFSILLPALSSITPASAAVPPCLRQGSILCGATVTRTIAQASDAHCFEISARNGDAAYFATRATAGELEATFQIYGPAGDLVSQANRFGVVTASLGGGNGTYTVVVYDTGRDETGSYSLTVEPISAAFAGASNGTATPTCRRGNEGTQPILCGERKAATVSPAGELDSFTFTARDGEVVLLSARGTSGAVNPAWELFGPRGELVARENAGFGSARLNQGDGTYTAILSDYGYDGTGSYDLSLEAVSGTFDGVSNGAPAPTCQRVADGTEPILCGETKTGSLSALGETDTFTFRAKNGDAVYISTRATSGDADPGFRLFGPGGELLMQADATGAASSPLLRGDGVYTVVVFDNGRDEIGTYSLSVEPVSATFNGISNGPAYPICQRGAEGTQPVVCGVTRAGLVSPAGEFDSFTFDGIGGASVAIVAQASSGGLDPVWVLFGPSGRYLQWNSGGNGTATLSDGSGTYTVIVHDHNRDETGEYAVRVSGAGCQDVIGQCGDGRANPGEQCGEPGLPSGACCSSCRFATAGQTCRVAAGACDLAEQCPGSRAQCPSDQAKAPGTSCRASAGVCDVAETCNGTSKVCPADAYKPAGTECRSPVSACDPPGVCSGTSSQCPVDVSQPSCCADRQGAVALLSCGALVGDGAFDLALEIDAGLEALGSYQAHLSWDPALLEVVAGSIRGGVTPEFSAAPTSNSTTGRLTFGAFQSSRRDGPVGRVSVARVRMRLRVAGAGPANVELTLVAISDTDTQPLCVAEPIARCDGQCGDVNGDRAIDVVDGLLVAQYAVGLRACGIAPFSRESACDLAPVPASGDGQCNFNDGLAMSQCAVGLRSCSFECAPWACPGEPSADLREESVRAAREAAEASAAGGTAATVRLDVDEGSLGPGDTFFADVVIETPAAAPLGAYEVSVTCDERKLEILSVSGGEAAEFQATPVFNLVSPCRALIGSFQASALDTPTGAVNVARVLLRVRDRARRGASARLELAVEALADTDGIAIPLGIPRGSTLAVGGSPCATDAECDDGSCARGCVSGTCAPKVRTDLADCRSRWILGGGPAMDCRTEWFLAGGRRARRTQSCVDNDASCDVDPTPGVCRLRLAACLNVSGDARTLNTATGSVCSSTSTSRIDLLHPAASATAAADAANRQSLLGALRALRGGRPDGLGVAFDPAFAASSRCTRFADVVIPLEGATSATRTVSTSAGGAAVEQGEVDSDRLELTCKARR